MNESFTLRIGIIWWVQVILFVPTIIDVFALIAVFQGEEGAVFAFALFTFLAILGLANIFANILVTDTDVTVSVFYGSFRIRWHEVQKITFSNPFIALEGHEKRVVLATGNLDNNKHKMLTYFSQQINTRNIEVAINQPVPLTHKNSKIVK